MKKNIIYLPIIIAVSISAGLLLGYYLSNKPGKTGIFPANLRSVNGSSTDEIIQFIKNHYVDTINEEKLREFAINGMLENLDPHSVYVSSTEMEESIDPLLGKFEGIGIQFRIENDTVIVLGTIAGGPSEKAGLLTADKIIKVDDKTIAGTQLKNNEVIKLLKGPKGTKVKVTIKRSSSAKLLDFVLTRDVIPTWSIDASFMADKNTGYVRLTKFSATTGEELVKSMKELKQEGAKSLILDLRGNSGGYLEEAINVADEFLPHGKLIVYTEGLHRKRKSYYATSQGEWDKLPVTVLIDENSASASEIVAGAIQDNDRGTIIGRRSFGKGLVQEMVALNDGSSLRLTVARYYSPTGRCIQKPYTKGEAEDYYMEYFHRYTDGELENADSVKVNDSLKYKTPGGKIVYGGGGIVPDVFIPLETKNAYKFYTLSVNQGLLYQFAFNYSDVNRAKLKMSKDYKVFDRSFQVDQNLMNEYVNYASQKGLKVTPAEIEVSRKKVSSLLKAFITRNLYDDQAYYEVYMRSDEAYIKALQLLD
jgi:carboxyl-terminal processing protease